MLFALLICIVPGASAWADTFQFKRYGYAWCPEQHAGQLTAIIDVDGRREIDAKLKGAVSGGACMGGGTSFQVINVRMMRTPKGRAYVCFTAVDPVDRSTSGPYCAQAEAITTIAAEVSRRTGAYRIVGEGPAGLKAECLEGGLLLVEKGSSAWTRIPLVLPLMLEPPERAVPPDRETALRNGCKGVDYLGNRGQGRQ